MNLGLNPKQNDIMIVVYSVGVVNFVTVLYGRFWKLLQNKLNEKQSPKPRLTYEMTVDVFCNRQTVTASCPTHRDCGSSVATTSVFMRPLLFEVVFSELQLTCYKNVFYIQATSSDNLRKL